MSILLFSAGAFCVLFCTGVVYQRIGARRDARRYAANGRHIEIGNHRRLYVRQSGTGSPAVIFEAGIAASSLNWFHIQEQVSRFAAAVSYDRCGLGWSGPCRTLRTPRNVALELHEMLERSGIKPPYLLVGHSFGGLVMRRFALLFPDEVASLILIDPMRCDEWPPVNRTKQGDLRRAKKMCRYAILIAHIGLARIGITSLLCGKGMLSGRLARLAGDGTQHVLGRVDQEVAKLPMEIRPAIAAQWSRPGFYAGMHAHLSAIPATVTEMLELEPIADTPVLVFTPDSAPPLSWNHLREIGDNVKQVIVPNSRHWVHLDQPGIVVELIREAVESARRAAAREASGRIDDEYAGASIAAPGGEWEAAAVAERHSV